MSLVTIDFETFYSKDFSLSKMTTESYIRDPRFEVIGVSVKIDSGGIRWITENIGEELKALHLENHQVLCHNTAFDGAILSWIYDIHPKFLLDTLSMARPLTGLTVGGSLRALSKLFGLGEKGTEIYNTLGKHKKDFTRSELDAFGVYCRQDVNLTYHLFKKLLPYTTKGELVIIDMMLRMFTEPKIVLDKPRLEAHLADVRAKKQELLSRIPFTKDQLMSNNLFAEVLKSLGVTPPTKISPTTGKETFAFAKTDDGFKELLEHPDERVQAVAAARLGTKSTIEETRTENMIGIANRGSLPILLNYWGGSTGRASGGDKMNLQNLPRGGEIRKSLIAPPGHMICACDSSNIEIRVNGWFCGQKDLLEHFEQGNDVYCELASKIFGRTITKADKKERFVGKTCLAKGTLVLTSNGLKPIETVTTDDLLWDGYEWVSHDGLLRQGVKEVTKVFGVLATKDHLFLTTEGWKDYGQISRQRLNRAKVQLPDGYRTSGKHLFWQPQMEMQMRLRERSYQECSVFAGWYEEGEHSILRMQSTSRTSAAWDDSTSRLYKLESNERALLSTFKSELQILRRKGNRSLSEMERQLRGLLGGHGADMVCRSFNRQNRCGERILSRELQMGYQEGASEQSFNELNGWRAECHSTCRKVSASTGEDLSNSSLSSEVQRGPGSSCEVFDLANAGRRHCFTVLGEDGFVLAHNCVLGLGYGTGWKKLQGALKNGGADMSDAECQRIVEIYRSSNYAIKDMWRYCEDMLSNMVAGYSGELGVGTRLKYEPGKVMLPNGMFILYPELRYRAEANDKEERGYSYRRKNFRTKIYGAKVLENLIQALARIVVFDQMGRIAQKLKEKGGNSNGKIRQVVLTVHDEVVVVVPEEEAEETKAMMEEMMRVRPSWAPDLPVDCEGGIGKSYGEAK